jgi:transposase
MKVMIGIDPHKASHTAVAISEGEDKLSMLKVRATRRQVALLLSWAESFETRTWAIESAGGLGYLLAQQLVAAGEKVLDVPATLASRVRVLASGQSAKNDPNDALSVAVAALRAKELASVQAADHAEVLRMLAKRNIDLGKQRTRVVCRLHALLAQLAPGGIAKELNASDAERLLAGFCAVGDVERTRYELALELLDDVRRLDTQLKESHRRIRHAVRAFATSLTDVFGIGPIIACMLVGYSGDICRFRNRDQYAAYNGTAPIEHSSGGRVVHRLSQRGNRQLNHALHMAAICQIRQTGSEGRAYFDRRVGEGKTKKEAPACPQAPHQQHGLQQTPRRHRTSQPIAGPGGHSGAAPKPARSALHP